MHKQLAKTRCLITGVIISNLLLSTWYILFFYGNFLYPIFYMITITVLLIRKIFFFEKYLLITFPFIFYKKKIKYSQILNIQFVQKKFLFFSFVEVRIIERNQLFYSFFYTKVSKATEIYKIIKKLIAEKVIWKN